MTLSDELQTKVGEIFSSKSDTRKGLVVPSTKDVQLDNDTVELERATVLYADISASTKLVDGYPWWFAKELYKTYLYCAARIIRSEGGAITAYDGDRIMAVFVGNTQSTDAARTALKINHAVLNIINPSIRSRYDYYPADSTLKQYQLKHSIGVDTGKLYVSRTGVRGDNDLVWIGKAANHAAKLTELTIEPPIRITKDVFGYLQDASKFGGKNKELMWKKWSWTQMNNYEIHSSNWTWIA